MAFYQSSHTLSSEYFIVERKQNFSFPLHLHRHYELILVTEGEMLVQLDGETFSVQKGQGVFILSNQPHALKTPFYSKHTLFIFSPELVRQFSEQIKNKYPETSCFQTEKFFLPTLAETICPTTDIITVKGFLYYVCGCFLTSVSFLPGTKRNSPQLQLLQDISNYIDLHFHENCSLRQLAKELGYEYSYLSKLFASHFAVNFTSFVAQVRINHACSMLLSTNSKILDIALACGYQSLRSFNRNFHDLTGMTPKEYRTKGAVSNF